MPGSVVGSVCGACRATMAKPKVENVSEITMQMKELQRMNMMIQSKLSNLESSLSEVKRREEVEVEDEEEIFEEIIDSDEEDIIEVPVEEDVVEDISELVDISMDETEEDYLEQESRELLELESFDDIKDDLDEDKKEIKEEDEAAETRWMGHQMDEDEVDVKHEVKFSSFIPPILNH